MSCGEVSCVCVCLSLVLQSRLCVRKCPPLALAQSHSPSQMFTHARTLSLARALSLNLLPSLSLSLPPSLSPSLPLSPSTTTFLTHIGSTPLHYLCKRPAAVAKAQGGGSRAQVCGSKCLQEIQQLVEAYPSAVTQQDRHGKNPLHYLMAHHAKCVLSVQVHSVLIFGLG
jgi:hypothetical protein